MLEGPPESKGTAGRRPEGRANRCRGRGFSEEKKMLANHLGSVATMREVSPRKHERGVGRREGVCDPRRKKKKKGGSTD